MDYAFAPGVTGYDAIIRKLFTNRPATTLISKRGVSTVDDFFKEVSTQGTLPLTNLLIGSHGNESGWMEITPDSTRNPENGNHLDVNTTWESMQRCIDATPQVCQIVAAAIDPRPQDAQQQDIPAKLFIKGCRIGVMTPFLNQFKKMINGLSTASVAVAAPNFFHEVYDMTQGVFEFFSYDFHIFSTTAVTDKAALAALFDAKAFADIYSNAFTLAQWTKWIPRVINRDLNPLTQVAIQGSPIANFNSLRSGFYRYRFNTVISSFTIDPSFGALPTGKGAIATFLKQQFNALAANPGNSAFAQSFQSTHDFPFYTRFEFATIEDMVDGLVWSVAPGTRSYVGRRYEYYVCPPVVANNAKNELVFNYYPSSPATSSQKNFADDDPNYFTEV